MVSPHLVAAPLTIVPAMGVLWMLLRRYEGYFDDRRVFFSLAVGFFAGIVVAFLEVRALGFHTEAFLDAGGFLFYLLGYAALEVLALLVVLGSRRFRVRKDTPYYGVALGLGFAATWTLQYAASGVATLGYLQQGAAGWLTAALLVLGFSVGTSAMYGAVGVWAGKGAAEGKLWRGLRNGMLALLPGVLLLRLWHGWVARGLDPTLGAVSLLVYGVGLAAFTQVRVLERLVPQDIRDMVRRDLRRQRRKALRERDAP